jgi:Tol biopolymer transport system component
MTLSPGTRLGPYEISAQIGVGGMGEVYRAHDVRLRRDVAIKTSIERFHERFEREARAIAALSHPNICTLHDIGPDYLVMELVEGSSPKGPLPVEEVVHIAGQVAAALEAAHERGIVHRDLKPANVKITPAGLIKVLDFGLAKVLREEAPDAPTLTMSVTQAGTTLGTPAYMAPEQAQGKPVDKRADVWAFGVMLYELTTGRGPFCADSTQGTLAAVLTKEPDWNKVPARLQRLLRACLKKDPRERLSSIGDWRLLLEEEAPRPERRARATTWLPWLAAAVGVGLAAFAWFGSEKIAEEPSLVRFEVPILGDASSQAMFALSPDGQHLVFSASEGGQLRLRVRPLATLEARLLPGAEGARFPFWKPDGREIGFFADGKLKTIPLAGGPPVIVTNVDPSVLGATWSPRGVIVLSQVRALYTVPEKGGDPALLYRGAEIPFDPEFLPDGHHFLYWDRVGVSVGALDGSPPVRIQSEPSRAIYSPEGYLLFRRQGRLTAQQFDADTLRLSGTEIPVTNETVVGSGRLAFSVAGGVLAYQTEALEQLAWKDRAGTVLEKVGEPQSWRNFRLSPDQSRIAWDFQRLGGVAVFDVQRGTRERFTTGRSDLVPVFSPDGAQLAFTSNRGGRFNPYITSAPNRERMIADVGTTGGYPLDWSPDGQSLLYWGDEDLWIIPVDGSGKPYTYAQSKFEEREATFSPDGRWIAYASNESGRFEIYLQPFPDQGGRRYPVSSQGGSGTAWRRDGKELFYVAGDGRLTAVPVTIRGANAELGRAESLFPVASGRFHRTYELSPDGKRVLVAMPAVAGGAAVTVLLNWRRVVEK